MLWRKFRKLAAVVIFLALIGGSYVFVVSKMIDKIRAKKAMIQETMAIQEYQREKVGDVHKLRDDFELAESSEAKIFPFLDKDNAVDFIQEIEKLSEGTNSRVAIEVVPVEAPAKGKNAPKDGGGSIMGSLPSKDYLQFKIKTAGSFLGLVKFINQLENSKYYLDIVSVQINTNPDAGKEKKQESQGSANPFSAKDKNSGEEKNVQDDEAIIASVGVVVYTQSQ